MTKLFNPYSYALNGNKLTPRNCEMSVPDRPVSRHRGCEIYKVSNKHYAYAKDGVVFSERGGISVGAIDGFLDGTNILSDRMNEAFDSGISVLSTQ